MAYCTNCGQQLADGAKFCAGCGAAINTNNNTQRRQEWAGKIIKCPSCGEILNSFKARCPSCGFEIREIQASSAVQEFSKQLQLIESQRIPKNDKKSSRLSTIFDPYDQRNEAKVDKQITNLIRNFSVPNTKEDVFEFMILASSNSDDNSYVSKAWQAKTNQIYNKAKISFGSDPDFEKIQNLFEQKTNAVKKAKKTEKIIIIGSLLFVFIMLGLMIAVIKIEDRKVKHKERTLNATFAEIQDDIKRGDYDSALVKANGLYFDKDLSKDKAKEWDEKRINIIGLINVKKTNKQGKIKVNYSPKELKGMNYEKAEKVLKLQGFTNIKLEKNDDLVLGILAKEDEVEKVTIDGDTDFKCDTYYMPNVEIIITYHTF